MIWRLRPGMISGRAANTGTSGYTFTNTEASDLVARFTGAPDTARKSAIDTLVGSLKSAGVWTKLDILYIMAAHDAQAAQRNWKADTFNLSITGSPTFTTDRGYTNNSTTGYADTGYSSLTHGSQLTLNSAHLAIWSRTATQSATATADAGTALTVDGLAIATRTSTGLIRLSVNDASATSVANADGSGFFVGNRLDASNVQAFRNGSQVGADIPSASDDRTATTLRVGGRSTFSRELAMLSAGGSLSSTNISDFYTALNTYLTAVGAA